MSRENEGKTEFGRGEDEVRNEIVEGCGGVIENYFPEDMEFYLGLEDVEDLVGTLYGALLEIGEDPDEILAEFGILEGGAREEERSEA